MKNKLLLTALLLVCLVGVGFQIRPAQKWQYKVEHSPAENKINQLGEDGWELVAIQSPSQNILVSTYVFKRAK
jgi:hypothetical protein